MAITHVDGEFGPEHFSKSFGFHGSTAGAPSGKRAQEDETPAPSKIHGKSAVPYDADVATHGSHMGGFEEPGKGTMDFARGGEVHHPHGHEPMHEEEHMGGSKVHHMHGGHSIHHPDGHVTHHHHDGTEIPHMAGGGHAGGPMHPHGHHVTHVEHKSDGRVIMHHAHGGHSVMHAHGHISHHAADGTPAHMSMGGQSHDTESEYVHKARGGHQIAGKPQTLPRDMKPAGMRHHSPIETAPRDPGITTTPRNQMSGGQMPYGVEPSAEPDTAGDGQGIPQMKRGGRKD